MMPEKVLYTDGRDVTVTDARLQVRKHEYLLNGVTKCGVTVLRPTRWPAIVVALLGLALLVAGLLGAIPADLFSRAQVSVRYDPNMLAMWVGGAMALLGVLILGVMRERYAVRIATAEGERDAVVSPRKEYVSQISDAINQAVSFVRSQTGSKYFTVRSAS